MPTLAARLRRTIPPLALAALFAARAAAAQEPADTTVLREIVVTATRYPAPPESLAATLTVLRGDDLRAQGIVFVADALRDVPGVQVVQTGSFGGATSLFLRGGESDYVKVLVDGVPVNQPGGSYDFANLTTDNVERIEVLRGPASVLYGSDAVSGVVQIITRPGTGPTAASAAAEAGTYGSVRWEGTAQGGTDGFGWSASLSRFTTDGIYAFNNDYRNTVASALLRARPAAGTGVSLTARYGDGAFHFPTDGTGALVDRNQFTTDQTTTLSLRVDQRILPALEGHLLLGRNAESSGYENPPDPPSPEAFSSLADLERKTVDAHLVFLGLARSVLLAGASYDHQDEHSFSHSDGAAGPSGDSFEASRRNWGVYAQASSRPWGPLRLTAGGRWDDNERFGQFWTYRISALGFATRTTRLKASVGNAFKEPSFFENFASGFVTGNPDLRPERSTAFEGGVEQDFLRGRVTLGLTGFAQRFRDLIQFTFSPPTPGGPNYFNIAAANASGIEAVVELRRLGPIGAAAGYTRLDTKVLDAGFDSGEDASFVTGRPLLRRPRDQFFARVHSAVAARVRVSGAVTWVGAREDIRFAPFPEPSRRVRLPAYATVDLAGAATLLPAGRRRPGLDLTFRVENLLDQSYEQAAGFPARGRTVFVGGATGIR